MCSAEHLHQCIHVCISDQRRETKTDHRPDTTACAGKGRAAAQAQRCVSKVAASGANTTGAQTTMAYATRARVCAWGARGVAACGV